MYESPSSAEGFVPATPLTHLGRFVHEAVAVEPNTGIIYLTEDAGLLRRLGLFHPMLPHRLARVQRRHKTLFDFLARAVLSSERWLPASAEARARLQRLAHARWFKATAPSRR